MSYLFYRCKCPDIVLLYFVLFIYVLYISTLYTKNTLTVAVYMLHKHCTKWVKERNNEWMNVSTMSENLISLFVQNYRISRRIRRTFFPQEKCDLNSICVLCAEGKYYFQTYKYSYPHRVKTTMKMILVAVTAISWVSMMNKLYYGC
jgi:hypothetical protein